MVAQPWMVRRTLHREVDGDLQPAVLRCGNQPTEVVECAKLWMDSVVPPFRAADRVGTAEILRGRAQGVVATLAVGRPDRMDRREVLHVEAHRPDRWQPRDNIAECPMPCRIVGGRAWEHLIPTGKGGLRPVYVNRDRRPVFREIWTILRCP